MGEQSGLLKVTVVQGKKLVIRDFKSSDPYVVVKLGNQTSKTRVINSCLNPVWNEELSFTLTEPVGALSLWDVHRYGRLSLQSCKAYVLGTGGKFQYCPSESYTFSMNSEVFDKDRFKADDKMGHAQLSLQPIASAARLKQILHVSSGETVLRKVVPDTDNCLARESSISCIDGEVVQSVWLRLCEVESGEIELKIKLIDPPVASSR